MIWIIVAFVWANPSWSDDVRPPCRYLWHRCNIVRGDSIYCSVPNCTAYAPTCDARLREIEEFGFVLY